jgi:hypothetical protein
MANNDKESNDDTAPPREAGLNLERLRGAGADLTTKRGEPSDETISSFDAPHLRSVGGYLNAKPSEPSLPVRILRKIRAAVLRKG